MDWPSKIPKPVKYALVFGGISFSSVLLYQYFTRKSDTKELKFVPFDLQMKIAPKIPEIVINSDEETFEDGNLSGSYICLHDDTEEEIVAKVPIEDESFAEDNDLPKPTRKVLLLGLDQSGKSSLLSQLSREGTNCLHYTPTKGFNVVCISFENTDLSIWEVGGDEEYRSYWKNFCASTNVIFFVLDATDRKRLVEAKEFFYDVFYEVHGNIGLYIAATKTDQSNSLSNDEIREMLAIDSLRIDILRLSVEAGGARETGGIELLQEYCLYK